MKRIACAMMWLAAGAAAAQPADRLAANKALAIRFYQTLLNDKDGPKAAAMVADSYVDLYPGPKPGREGVLGFASFLRAQRPNYRTTIVRAFAEGDYVILYASNDDGTGAGPREMVEFFKVENGKLTEHWDVPAAPLPPPVTPSR